MNEDQSYFNVNICRLPGMEHNMEAEAGLCLFKCESAMKNILSLKSVNNGHNHAALLREHIHVSYQNLTTTKTPHRDHLSECVLRVLVSMCLLKLTCI